MIFILKTGQSTHESRAEASILLPNTKPPKYTPQHLLRANLAHNGAKMIDGGADILRNKVCRKAVGHCRKSLAKCKRCLLKSFVVTQIGNNSL